MALQQACGSKGRVLPDDLDDGMEAGAFHLHDRKRRDLSRSCQGFEVSLIEVLALALIVAIVRAARNEGPNFVDQSSEDSRFEALLLVVCARDFLRLW